MDGVCRALFAATEGNLRRGNVAGNAALQVVIALWVYALLVALVTAASWNTSRVNYEVKTFPVV